MPDPTTSVPLISVDGQAVPTSVIPSRLRVVRSIGATAHISLRVADADASAGVFTVGKELSISVIPADSATETVLSKGQIVGVGLEWSHGRNELVIDAYDKSFMLARQQSPISSVNTNVADILREIAQLAGLQFEGDSTLNQVKFDNLPLWGTALADATTLCHAVGCEWFVDGDKFIVRRRSGAPAATVTLSGDNNLRRFVTRFSAMEQVKEVKVRSWDMQTKQSILNTAAGVNTAAPSSAPAVTASTLTATQVAPGSSRHVADMSSAGVIATGVAARMGSMVLSARGETDVNAKIVPGTPIKIENVATEWNGTYYITGVEHSYGHDESFTTTFTAGGDDPGSLVDLLGSPRTSPNRGFAAGLTVGIVTNNNDSEGSLNRVKLRLPYLSDDSETGWARLVQPGAGAGRGLLTLPEVDDEVLVGFENGDVRRPYVLGGLWNGRDAPPMTTSQPKLLDAGAVTSRSLTSREGHQLILQDEGPDGHKIFLGLGTKRVELILSELDGIKLVHQNDTAIEISSSAGSFKIAQGGDITIDGKNITITAAETLMLKARNIEAKAQQNAKVEGTAKVEIKGTQIAATASGIAEIKGSMVKIN